MDNKFVALGILEQIMIGGYIIWLACTEGSIPKWPLIPIGVNGFLVWAYFSYKIIRA